MGLLYSYFLLTGLGVRRVGEVYKGFSGGVGSIGLLGLRAKLGRAKDSGSRATVRAGLGCLGIWGSGFRV